VTYRGISLRRVLAVAGSILVWLAATAVPALAVSADPMPSFNGTVLAIAYSGSTVYVGGTFTAAIVNGKPVARNRLAAIDALTGVLLPWAPVADGRVKALAASGSSVYAAGDFGTVGGQPRDGLARLDRTTGAVSGTFKHTINGIPYAIAAGNGRLYLGGAITSVDGQSRTRLAAFSLTTGVLDPSWKPTADAQVEAVTAGGGRIYVGGKFHKINSTSGYDRLVALDPSSAAIIPGFQPRPAIVVYGIAVTPTGVYSAHGGQGGKLNAYSTAGKLRWSSTFDGDAQAVAVLGNTVYAGGHFDHACRTPRTGSQGVCLDGSDNRVKLAALDATTGVLQDWTANANGVVGVLTMATSVSLGAFAVGGAFTSIEGLAHKRFAQFS
jgi:hypothetical protein